MSCDEAFLRVNRNPPSAVFVRGPIPSMTMFKCEKESWLAVHNSSARFFYIHRIQCSQLRASPRMNLAWHRVAYRTLCLRVPKNTRNANDGHMRVKEPMAFFRSSFRQSSYSIDDAILNAFPIIRNIRIGVNLV